MEKLHDPDEVSRKELVTTLRKIQNALWPGGDRDHDWSADTTDAIAEALTEVGLGPDYSR
jgi:hypothetical protein